jgi:hypothetical protein
MGIAVGGVVMLPFTISKPHAKQESKSRTQERSVEKRQHLSRSLGRQEISEIGTEDVTNLVEELEGIYDKKHPEILADKTDDLIVASIKQLENGASFLDGLEYKSENAFESLIAEMARRDELGMMAWVRANYDEKVSDSIIEKWSTSQKGRNRRELFEISKNYLSEKGSQELAGNFLLYTEDLTTEDALFFLRHQKVGSSSYGTNVQFSDDFNYKQFAEVALDMLASQKEEGSQISTFPTNFFGEWIKKEGVEVFDFYDEHLHGKEYELPMNDYPSLIEGYVNSVPSSQSVEWLAEVLAAGELKDSEYRSIIKELSEGDIGSPGYTEKLLSVSSNATQLRAEMVVLSLMVGNWKNSVSRQIASLEGQESFIEGIKQSFIQNPSVSRWYDDEVYKFLEKMGRSASEIEEVKAVYEEGQRLAREERLKQRQASEKL